MADWTEFAAVAPRIAAVFTRRYTATGKLCLLGTLRPDGSPRISPKEPALFEGQLCEQFDHFFRAELTGASAVQVADGQLDVTVWAAGADERVIRKH